MHALLPIILTASHVLLAANSVPKFDVERTCRPAAEAAVLPGRIRRRDSGMSVMRASSSSETGPDTTQHKSASAPDSPHLIAHRVTWSCLPAWNLQNKPRNCHQIRK